MKTDTKKDNTLILGALMQIDTAPKDGTKVGIIIFGLLFIAILIFVAVKDQSHKVEHMTPTELQEEIRDCYVVNGQMQIDRDEKMRVVDFRCTIIYPLEDK